MDVVQACARHAGDFVQAAARRRLVSDEHQVVAHVVVQAGRAVEHEAEAVTQRYRSLGERHQRYHRKDAQRGESGHGEEWGRRANTAKGGDWCERQRKAEEAQVGEEE